MTEEIKPVAHTLWEEMIREEAETIAARENACSGCCGPYGTETWEDYEQGVRNDFEEIGKAFVALNNPNTQGCIHTKRIDERQESRRTDLHNWQTDQSEWFDDTILEIVTEYAEWRDAQESARDEKLVAWRDRMMQDHQRALWPDDVEGICQSKDICFQYNKWVRCGPCAIKQSATAGIQCGDEGRAARPFVEWAIRDFLQPFRERPNDPNAS